MSIEAKLHHLQAIQNLIAPYHYLYCVDLEATCDERCERRFGHGITHCPAPPRRAI